MYCGGQGVYVYYLAKALNELGHDVHVMAGPPYPAVPEGVKLHQIEGLNLYETEGLSSLKHPLHLFRPLNLYEVVAWRLKMFPEIFTFSMRAYLKLREIIAKEKFDIIHDNQTLGYGMTMTKGLGVPVVATIHHPIYIDMKADLAQARRFVSKFNRTKFYSFLIMQHLVAHTMDRVITVSDCSAEDVMRVFKLGTDKVRIVPNGIDTSVFKKLNHVEKEPNSIIMVGNTEDRKKGIAFLLQAIAQLKGDVDVKLNIVDRQGDYTRYAPRIIQEQGIEDRVKFTGRLSVEELVEHYSMSEIAVTASVYEGFGLPCAEAMSCSTPVIATRAGALPEIVGSDGAGMLVPPADPTALAAAIKHMLGDDQLRQNMAIAARKRIEEVFSWEIAAKKTIEVYKEVL
ncbi:MAG: glycosyltransferase family 4 protein [Chloroflexota bacterium]|nr:glycosyltransferase family 4 protein [Chloroflexota bacterium]